MAYSIIPSLVLLVVAAFMAFPASLAMDRNLLLPASTISAAPAVLPDSVPPLSSSSPPALSPDITPLFPSPGGSVLSPSESSVPLIPSSPSPPNPDEVAAFGPGAALAPEGVMPESSSNALCAAVFLSSVAVVLAGIWVNQDLV